MRRNLAILSHVIGIILWLFVLFLWRRWLPFLFWTTYGDASRLESKALMVTVGLFVLAHYATYRLRRAVLR